MRLSIAAVTVGFAVCVLVACGGNVARSTTSGGDAGASAFCGNPKITGTCAEPVLRQLAACFVTSGTCTVDETSSSQSETNDLTTCWPNGATFDEQTLPSGGEPLIVSWTNHGVTCMTGVDPYQIGADQVSYNPSSGNLICADGTNVIVGDIRKCPELAGVFGAEDSSSCTAGTCP